ncbi:T-box transcription factor TBX6-like, partial [Etheostoma cragini]|uniref:T-box transcription factor TBX6-like n=1 Tax=Etheostoma cragini TaxID=417921 RepID=UPI00155E7FCA
MASKKKKQKGMVFHQEGATNPAAAPAADHPPARFVVPKPGKASEGGMEPGTGITHKEADTMGKPKVYPSKETIRTCEGLPDVKHPPGPDNLSPDSIRSGIRVTLDNNSMWNEFFRCRTEMILTQQGSRMFPSCRFRISGLQPSRKYSLVMDVQPLDNSCYKWTGKTWQVAGKAESHVKSQPFAHPDSPSAGQHWMQSPVSFYKLKLTNNISDQDGNTVLRPLHRYLPRLHVVQSDKAAKDIKLNGPSVVTFTFPQTEFMAVTAYQNSRFSQLKVDYNPFAKGLKEEGSGSLGLLKLKLKSGKDSLKDGGTTSSEQHPVKKSLKSLLANHKPKSSKPVDPTPSGSGDLQKKTTTEEDQAAVTGESLCSNPLPAQKLFSELIREAHVSLHRCNLEQLGINNNTPHRTERTNSKTTALKSKDVPKRESIPGRTQRDTSSAKTADTVVTKRKVKKDKDLLNSVNCKDKVRTDCSEVSNVVAQNSSVDSDSQSKPEVPPEEIKKHKRLAPLPALALFLKQHSTKSKMAKSKLDPPPPEAPAGLPSDCANKATNSSKDLTGDVLNQASGHTDAHLPPDKMNVTGQVVGTACKPSSPLCPDAVVFTDPKTLRSQDSLVVSTDPKTLRSQDSLVVSTDPKILRSQDSLVFSADPKTLRSHDSLVVCADPNTLRSHGSLVVSTDPKTLRSQDLLASVSESIGPEPTVTQVLPNSDLQFCKASTSISNISSTLATSSVSPILLSVLPNSAPNSPPTPTIPESSTLPSQSLTMKSDSLLPDPECSSFGFEPLSPASSPEPLPSLPISLSFDLDATTSETTPKSVHPEEFQHSEDSASVFKWHTVLPPPEPYVDPPFTFQPQALPLGSVTPPLFPSQTPSHPEPQTHDPSTPMSPSDPTPSFQESEQSLPFPAELSPLALQLPLSPTFSSLGGDGLSPTPSLADLVHFFSIDDNLGMEVEFANTEPLHGPSPPPTTVEANAPEPSQQVEPSPANKPCKRKKKKTQRQKLAKTDATPEVDASIYTKMQPNLEEVEEQLFISFTSKEALKRHVVDSSDVVQQPETAPEGHLQRCTDAPGN